MRCYEINVRIVLYNPLTVVDAGGSIKAIGYYKLFAVAAETFETAKNLVSNACSDGSVDWKLSEVEEVGQAVAATSKILRETGRAFFPCA